MFFSFNFSKFKIEPKNRVKNLQAVFSAAPDTPWSSSDLGLDDPIEEEALRNGIKLSGPDKNLRVIKPCQKSKLAHPEKGTSAIRGTLIINNKF